MSTRRSRPRAAQPTSFVGREREPAEIDALLDDVQVSTDRAAPISGISTIGLGHSPDVLDARTGEGHHDLFERSAM
jgi:hypothetical protein